MIIKNTFILIAIVIFAGGPLFGKVITGERKTPYYLVPINNFYSLIPYEVYRTIVPKKHKLILSGIVRPEPWGIFIIKKEERYQIILTELEEHRDTVNNKIHSCSKNIENDIVKQIVRIWLKEIMSCRYPDWAYKEGLIHGAMFEFGLFVKSYGFIRALTNGSDPFKKL